MPTARCETVAVPSASRQRDASPCVRTAAWTTAPNTAAPSEAAQPCVGAAATSVDEPEASSARTLAPHEHRNAATNARRTADNHDYDTPRRGREPKRTCITSAAWKRRWCRRRATNSRHSASTAATRTRTPRRVAAATRRLLCRRAAAACLHTTTTPFRHRCAAALYAQRRRSVSV